jgi:hypothetical protein
VLVQDFVCANLKDAVQDVCVGSCVDWISVQGPSQRMSEPVGRCGIVEHFLYSAYRDH